MSAMSRRLFGRTAAGAGLAALAGCTNLLPGGGPAPQLYVLTRKTTFPPDLPQVDWQLLVDTPLAPAEIDNARIALTRSPFSIDYFANAAWPERAPTMVQSLLIESFEETGKITAVGRESLGLRADYLLLSELRRFEAMYPSADASPTVLVRLIGRLVRMPDRSIISERREEERVTASAPHMPAIIEAFDDALGSVMKRIVVWTLTTPPPRLARS
jgi:cholesterol transport system auxiliary component